MNKRESRRSLILHYRGSLRLQLFLGLLGIVLLVLTTVGILQWYWLKEAQYASLESLLLSRLHNVEKAELIQTKSQEALVAKAPELADKMMDVQVSVTVVDAEGALIFSSESELRAAYQRGLMLLDHNARKQRLEPPVLSKEAYRRFLSTPHIFEATEVAVNAMGERYLILFSKIGPENQFTGLVQLSVPTAAVDQALAAQLMTYGWIAGIGVVVGGILLLLLLGVLLKPLGDITSRLAKIDTLDLKEALPSYGQQAEMRQLSQAFNALFGRLNIAFEKEQEAKAQLKAFVSDAAHELRTPITSIRGFAEVLSMGNMEDTERIRRGLGTIVLESDRLTRLVNHLLLLTRLDQGVSVPQQPVQLSELLTSLTPQLELMSGSRALHLKLSCDQWIMGNRDQLQQLLINLYHNACQHTDATEGVIEIGLCCSEREGKPMLMLSIADNGIGIPEAALPHIFDRFYRVEAHRSRKTGGEGLGLSHCEGIG